MQIFDAIKHFASAQQIHLMSAFVHITHHASVAGLGRPFPVHGETVRADLVRFDVLEVQVIGW